MSVAEGELDAQFRRGRPVIRWSSDRLGDPPLQWQRIEASDSPRERVAAALELWTPAAVDLMPEFWPVLQESLADVWVGDQDGEPVLVYVVEYFDRAGLAPDEGPGFRVPAVWIGTRPTPDPRPAVPELWAAVPEQLGGFYREVHDSFTAPDGRSFGPVSPSSMQTLADALSDGEGLPEWDADPAAERLLVVTSTYSGVRLCVSPDLPESTAVAVYRYDDPDSPRPFVELLDHNLFVRFEVED